MNNEQTDTALILENELKRRVSEVVHEVVRRQVKDVVEREFAQAKSNMMMEMSVTIGKMLQLIEKEDRKPLWESTPAEFGLTEMQLNTHNLKGGKDAVRE
jgi:hypothetical protein